MLTNLEKLNQINWTSLSLKTPVVFRLDERQFIIRNMRNVKGKVMCELIMDDDRAMKDITTLPDYVQKMIDHHIKLQVA